MPAPFFQTLLNFLHFPSYKAAGVSGHHLFRFQVLLKFQVASVAGPNLLDFLIGELGSVGAWTNLIRHNITSSVFLKIGGLGLIFSIFRCFYILGSLCAWT